MINLIDLLNDINEKTRELSSRNPNLIGNNNFVFRGQSNSAWGVEASLFRKGKQAKKEHELISKYLECFPEFKSQPMINTITDMQHYGVPTRLVDWTTNPLVAIYFACKDDRMIEHDGKVFFQFRDNILPYQSKNIAEFLCEIGAFNKDGCNKEDWAYLYAVSFLKLNTLFGVPVSNCNDKLLIKGNSKLSDVFDKAIFDCIIQALKDMYGAAYIKDDIETKFRRYNEVLCAFNIISAPTINPLVIAQQGVLQVCPSKFYNDLDVFNNVDYIFPETYTVPIRNNKKYEILKQLQNRFNIDEYALNLKNKQHLVNEFKQEFNII